MTRFPFRRLIAVACALLFTCATAQTPPPAKPAAKPPSIVVPQSKAPAKAPAKTLGGKATPAGKLMTRDELRQCLARLDGINKSAKDIEGLRTALDVERTDLTQQGDVLRAELAQVQSKQGAVQEFQARAKGYGQEVEAYNKRMAGLSELNRTQREAAVKELEAEQQRLTKLRDELAVEEARLIPAYQDGVKAYNARAELRDAKVADWNKRNAAAVEVSKKFDDERTTWLTECANRPYNEDDEIAIKKGR